MKVQLIFALCATLLAANVQATSLSTDDSSPESSLRDQIVTLVENVEMRTNQSIEEDVRICFRVDENSQVRLHHVNTDHIELKKAIVEQLHHADVMLESDNDEEQFYWITVKYRIQ